MRSFHRGWIYPQSSPQNETPPSAPKISRMTDPTCGFPPVEQWFASCDPRFSHSSTVLSTLWIGRLVPGVPGERDSPAWRGCIYSELPDSLWKVRPWLSMEEAGSLLSVCR